MRLTAEIWVAAYLKRLSLLNIPAFVTSKGDLTAGAVLVKMNTLDGKAQLFQRGFDFETGARKWDLLTEGADGVVDASVAKQRNFDPDLWVIEVEDKEGRHLLDDPSLN